MPDLTSIFGSIFQEWNLTDLKVSEFFADWKITTATVAVILSVLWGWTMIVLAALSVFHVI